MSKDHKEIWLEPKCCADPDGNRSWCQDPDVWEHELDHEPGHDIPTRYVRADLLETAKQTIKRLGSYQPQHQDTCTFHRGQGCSRGLEDLLEHAND